MIVNVKLKLLIIALLGFATACNPEEVDSLVMYGAPPPGSRSVELVEEYRDESSVDDLLDVDVDADLKVKEE